MYKNISWDSCVFLAWFNQEEDKPLNDIEAYLQLIEDESLNLLVSVVCAPEILNEVGSANGTRFQEFMKRSNVTPVNVDMRIAKLASVFRENGVVAREKGVIKKGFKAPDAMIVASASVYKVDVLHTFDPVLLDLSGTEYVDGLIIKKPTMPREEQLDLFLDKP